MLSDAQDYDEDMDVWARVAVRGIVIQSGADIETPRALLGHVDIMTTQRYVHSNLQQMQRAVEKLKFEY